jgi:hypothetical protein
MTCKIAFPHIQRDPGKSILDSHTNLLAEAIRMMKPPCQYNQYSMAFAMETRLVKEEGLRYLW